MQFSFFYWIISQNDHFKCISIKSDKSKKWRGNDNCEWNTSISKNNQSMRKIIFRLKNCNLYYLSWPTIHNFFKSTANKKIFIRAHAHSHTHAHTEKHSLSNDIKIDYMLIFAYPYFHVHNIAHSNQSESLVV